MIARYLTRQLMDDPEPGRDIRGEGDIEALEYALLSFRISGDSDREQLSKAYFPGDEKNMSHISRRLKNE